MQMHLTLQRTPFSAWQPASLHLWSGKQSKVPPESPAPHMHHHSRTFSRRVCHGTCLCIRMSASSCLWTCKPTAVIAANALVRQHPDWGALNTLACASEGSGAAEMLAIVEAAANGHTSAAAHLHLLRFLLQSSVLAQTQLLADRTIAERYLMASCMLLSFFVMCASAWHVLIGKNCMATSVASSLL